MGILKRRQRRESETVAQETTPAERKLFEPGNRHEMLKSWLLEAYKAGERHETAAKRWSRFHFVLGLAASCLALLAGGGVFWFLGQPAIAQIAVGSIAVLAGVLTCVHTFVNFADRAQKHRDMNIRHKAMIRKIEEALANSGSGKIGSTVVSEIRRRLDLLAAEAPEIPRGVLKRVDGTFSATRFCQHVSDLLPAQATALQTNSTDAPENNAAAAKAAPDNGQADGEDTEPSHDSFR